MPTKHWSTNVNQVIVQRGSNGSFNLCIEGGSEYGQFVVIGDVLTGNLLRHCYQIKNCLFWYQIDFNVEIASLFNPKSKAIN